jgi:hypothetical protein
MGGWRLFSVEIPEHFNAPAWLANVVPIGQGQNQNMLSPYPVEAYSLINSPHYQNSFNLVTSNF